MEAAKHVSTIRLVCHTDTWELLHCTKVFGLAGIPAYSVSSLERQLVEVMLTRDDLLSILDATNNHTDRKSFRERFRQAPAGAKEVGLRLRKLIYAALEELGEDHHGEKRPVPSIVLDAKPTS